ncbi:putative mitochondrial protein [Trifolium repens]|nr:putative mitochondrial protein [Trifolium repens]
MPTVRCLFTVAVFKGWTLHQIDVSNALLHGDLHEKVYMELPHGHNKRNKGLVCMSPPKIPQWPSPSILKLVCKILRRTHSMVLNKVLGTIAYLHTV